MAEQIKSDDLIPANSVSLVIARTEQMRVKAATVIAGAAVVVAAIFLVIGIFIDDTDLKTWAMGLISMVVGTAIGFVFGNSGATDNSGAADKG